MAIFQVDVQKKRGEEYWTNVYHLNTVDLEAATSAAEDIVTVEVNVHRADVVITSARVSDLSTDFFNTIPVNIAGAQPADAETLPLWNVFRVDFQVNGRRPGRKYLRLPMQEAESNNGYLTPAAITRLVNGYCIPLKNIGTLSNERGDAFTSITVNPIVAMRQLRRGSKRRARPVI